MVGGGVGFLFTKVNTYFVVVFFVTRRFFTLQNIINVLNMK